MKKFFTTITRIASPAGVLAVALWSVSSQAALGPGGFVYEGRIYDSAGYPSKQVLKFNVKVLAPNGCILLEEQTANTDLSTSDGYFNITVGQAAAVGNDPGLTLRQIFAGPGLVNGKTAAGAGCPYTANSGDVRVLRVSVIDGAAVTVMSPDVAINSTPHAMVADFLQGKAPTDFASVDVNGLLLPVFSTVPAAPLAGQLWFSTSNHELGFFDGTTNISIASGGGGGTSTPVFATTTSPNILGASSPGGTLSLDSTSSGTKGAINIGTTGMIYLGNTTSAKIEVAGSSAPATALDVNGTIRVGNGGEGCSGPTTGGIQYSSGILKYCNGGGSWLPIGMINFNAGTVAVPGWSVATDPSTGLWQNSAGNLSVSTGGVEAMRFLNVASSQNYLTVAPNVGSSAPTIGTDGIDANIDIKLIPKGTGNLGVPNASLLMSAGNVGIGTIFPNARVEANTGSSSTIGLIVREVGGQTANLTEWRNSGGGMMTMVDPMGDIMINSPGNPSYPSLGVGGPGNGLFSPASGVAISTSGTERMRIDALGNVGIGTTAPANIFEVNPPPVPGTGVGVMINAQSSSGSSPGGHLLLSAGGSTSGTVGSIDLKGHLASLPAGPSPTIGSCTGAGSPNVTSGTDTRGKISWTAAAPSGTCSITFGKPYSSIPNCVVSWATNIGSSAAVFVDASTTAGSLVLSFYGGTPSTGAVNYICIQ